MSARPGRRSAPRLVPQSHVSIARTRRTRNTHSCIVFYSCCMFSIPRSLPRSSGSLYRRKVRAWTRVCRVVWRLATRAGAGNDKMLTIDRERNEPGGAARRAGRRGAVAKTARGAAAGGGAAVRRRASPSAWPVRCGSGVVPDPPPGHMRPGPTASPPRGLARGARRPAVRADLIQYWRSPRDHASVSEDSTAQHAPQPWL